MSDAPFLLVVAGPNGSGKSTLTDYLINSGIDFGDYINADRIAATLHIPEPARSKQAQTIADFQRDQCLRGHVNFSFETVMSHPSKVDFMVRAGAVAGLVGIEVGVVSGVSNLESPGVSAPDRRPRHEEAYHAA